MTNIRIIFICLLISLVLTSCTSQNKVVQKSNTIQEKEENKDLERNFYVMDNKNIGPIF